MTSFFQISDNSYFNCEHVISDKCSVEHHLHDGCEIFVLLKGEISYFVDKNIYDAKPGDIFITRANEIHAPKVDGDGNFTYERIFLQFDPVVIKGMKNKEIDLLSCFEKRELGYGNKLEVTQEERDKLIEMLMELNKVWGKCKNGNYEKGDDLLQYTMLLQILIYLNRIYRVNVAQEKQRYDQKIAAIMEYIDNNLTDEMSLELFEKKFFLNKHYMCRLFKKNAGVNMHNYIIFKRVNKSKEYLNQGYRVNEAGEMSGFTEYSNYIRAFKKVVGVTPSEYKKMINRT